MPDNMQGGMKDPFLEAGGLSTFIDNFETKYGDQWLTPEGVANTLLKEFPNSEAAKRLATVDRTLIERDIENFQNFRRMQEEAKEQDPSMNPIRALVSGGLTGASLLTPGTNAFSGPMTALKALKGAAGLGISGYAASKAPPVFSTDNLLSLLGIGGNVATAKTALRNMPGISSALESGLGSAIDQAGQKGEVNPLEVMANSALSGGAGAFLGRVAKRSPETSTRLEQKALSVLGDKPEDAVDMAVNRRIKTDINDMFASGISKTNQVRKEQAIKNLSRTVDTAEGWQKEQIRKNIINDIYSRVGDNSLENIDKFGSFVGKDIQFREFAAKLFGKNGPEGFSNFAEAMKKLKITDNPSVRLRVGQGFTKDVITSLYIDKFVFLFSPDKWSEMIQRGKTREFKDLADRLYEKSDKSATTLSWLRAGTREARKGDKVEKTGDPMQNMIDFLSENGFPKTQLQQTQTPKGYWDYVKESFGQGMN